MVVCSPLFPPISTTFAECALLKRLTRYLPAARRDRHHCAVMPHTRPPEFLLDGSSKLKSVPVCDTSAWENKSSKTSAIKVASSVATAGKVYQFHLPYSSPPSRAFTPHSITEVNDKSTDKMPAKMGWLRHVLTILSVVIFVSWFFKDSEYKSNKHWINAIRLFFKMK